MKERKYCVYRHIRKDTKMPFYIGIGVTISRANSLTGRNKYWHNIVNSVGYEVQIMLTGLDFEQACKAEQYFIALYKRKIDGGLLVNISIGGEKQSLGSKHTEEEKIRRSIAFTGQGNPMYGKPRDMSHIDEQKRLKSVVDFNKKHKSIPIWAKNINTGHVTRFESQREASRTLNVDQSRIFKVLHNKAIQSKGYIFSFKPYENI